MAPRTREQDRARSARLDAVSIDPGRGELIVRPLPHDALLPAPGEVRLLEEGTVIAPEVLGRVPNTLACPPFPRLEWRPGNPKESPPIDQCFPEFIRLVDASNVRVLEFARRWGVLGICPHGLPKNHARRCEPLQLLEGCSPCWNAWEPIAVWRDMAREAAAILDVTAALRAGRPASGQVWRNVTGPRFEQMPIPGVSWKSMETDMELQRYVLSTYASRWVKLAGITPHVRWDGDEEAPHAIWTVESSQHDDFGFLFPTIAIQLAAALISPLGPFRCDSCGLAFLRRKRPQSGRRQYCLSCSESTGLAAKRDWARKHRARNRQVSVQAADDGTTGTGASPKTRRHAATTAEIQVDPIANG